MPLFPNHKYLFRNLLLKYGNNHKRMPDIMPNFAVENNGAAKITQNNPIKQLL